ncbi:MAG: hypothetical protein KGM42_21400 [Hyphomicrobiales bacterium]|nr:hypothetical protein [Hyphomicrobiales bacterium]
MSKYAINPNALPDPAAEERAALERERAFEADDAPETTAPAVAREPLPPRMLTPDPRYPHGDVDAIEARLAELKETGAKMSAPSGASDGPQPSTPQSKILRAQDHPLIASLIAALPAPNTVWSAADRAAWLRAADGLFPLVYRAQPDNAANGQNS